MQIYIHIIKFYTFCHMLCYIHVCLPKKYHMRVRPGFCGFVLIIAGSSVLVGGVRLRTSSTPICAEQCKFTSFPWAMPVTESLSQCKAGNGTSFYDASLLLSGNSNFCFIVRIRKTGPCPGNFRLCWTKGEFSSLKKKVKARTIH